MAIFCIILLFFLASLQDAVVLSSEDLASLSTHVLHLEEMLSNLQSQSQTQEQKQAAVLSNVLSELSKLRKDYNSLQTEMVTVKTKLQTNEEELVKLKDDFQSCETNLTFLQNEVSVMKSEWNTSKDTSDTEIKTSLQMLKEEVENLTSTVNSTIKEVQTVQSSIEYVLKNQTDMESALSEITSEQQNLTTELVNTNTGMDLLKGNMSYFQEEHKLEMNTLKQVIDKLSFNESAVYFETMQLHGDTNVSNANGTSIKFDYVTGMSKGFDRRSGKFTAPVTGVYIFWINFILKGKEKAVTVTIKSGERRLGIGYGNNSKAEGQDVVSGFTVAYVEQGQEVVFHAYPTVTLSRLSSYGGALLHKW